jgi:uncharacterized protein
VVGAVPNLIRPDAWVAMPWKNGGGTTHEIWKDGAEWSLRFSVAEVASDGPFSLFEGVDRVICLLDGNGFRLERDDGLQVERTEPGVPFAFLGEESWTCTLLDGPVRDFNVMTARKAWRANVELREIDPTGVRLSSGGFLFALDAGIVVGGRTLGRYDLCGLDAPARVTTEVRARALVIALSPP